MYKYFLVDMNKLRNYKTYIFTYYKEAMCFGYCSKNYSKEKIQYIFSKIL